MKFSSFLQGRTIVDNGFRELMPRVSVIMPTYCRMAEGFLAQCIDSVLAQSFIDFEFIIIDDGSVDGSEHLIRDYAKRDPRIVYVRHDINSGLPAVRTNEGILLARAPYIAFVFDDNVWKNDALAVLIGEIEKHDADMVYANTEMVQMHGAPPICYGRWPLSLSVLQYLNTIPNGSVLCRKTFFDRFGLYDPHLALRRICDWDLWLRALSGGAKIHHVDSVVDVEHGTASPVSLGSSVKWDYKVSFAYMADAGNWMARSSALRPAFIMEYDVFDVEKVIPYTRSLHEWEFFEDIVYKPFFAGHTHYSYEPLIRHNRRFDSDLSGYALHPAHAISPHRPRILFVSNCWSLVIDDWMSAVKTALNAIPVHCSETSLSAFSPEDIDLLFLFDCAAPFIEGQIRKFREQRVPVAYIIEHGLDKHVEPDDDPLHTLDFARIESISSLLGLQIYFPQAGMPWTDDARSSAQRLMNAADVLYRIEGTGDLPSDLPFSTEVSFIPNDVQPIQEFPDSCAIYIGDPTYLSESSLSAILAVMKRCAPKVPHLYVHEGVALPEAFAEMHGVLRIAYCRDALDLTSRALSRTLLIIPDEILTRYSNYVISLVKERLLSSGSALIPLSDASKYPQETGMRMFACMYEAFIAVESALRISKEGMPRTLYYCSITRALLLGPLLPGDNRRAAVFLNSPLLAGSEVYGLMLLKVMRSAGLDAIACIPEIHGYGNDADPKDIQKWLSDRNLPQAESIAYGYGMQCFSMPLNDFQRAADHVREWMRREKIGIVMCSGFMPEIVWAARGEAVLFNALFQPFSYASELMTFFRDCSAGSLSDCDWSAGYWRSIMPPPVTTVRSMVDASYFQDLNANLQKSPVYIALGGTLQPRKRQREAILAIAALCERGHDIRLNIYGYELGMMAEYTADIKSLGSSVLGDRISFRGLVSIETIAAENHVFLMPSIDESMPQTLLFMMAFGLVAVCCPSGGISEVVRDGETGYMAAGFHETDIDRALERALSFQSDWTIIVHNARRLLAREYSAEAMAVCLFDTLLSGARIETSEGRGFPALPMRIPARRRGGFSPVTSIKAKISFEMKKLLAIPLVKRVYLRYRHLSHIQKILNFLR